MHFSADRVRALHVWIFSDDSVAVADIAGGYGTLALRALALRKLKRCAGGSSNRTLAQTSFWTLVLLRTDENSQAYARRTLEAHLPSDPVAPMGKLSGPSNGGGFETEAHLN